MLLVSLLSTLHVDPGVPGSLMKGWKGLWLENTEVHIFPGFSEIGLCT